MLAITETTVETIMKGAVQNSRHYEFRKNDVRIMNVMGNWKSWMRKRKLQCVRSVQRCGIQKNGSITNEVMFHND